MNATKAAMNHSMMMNNNTMNHDHMDMNMDDDTMDHSDHDMSGHDDHDDHDGHHGHHGHDMDHSLNVSECLDSISSPMSITWIVINLLILLLTIPLTIKFLKTHFKKNQNQKQKQPQYLFYAGIAFVLTTYIILIADTISIFFYECNHMWWMLFMLIFGFTYTLQIMLVLIILFLRVYFIFQTSAYAISKATIGIFLIVFVSIPPTVGVVEFWYHTSHHSESSSIGLAICYFVNILVMLSLLLLFIHKLFTIYGHLPKIEDIKQSETHRSLMRVITRTVVLTSISVIFTLTASIGFITIDKLNKLGFMIVTIMVVIDVFTNFVCILLSYAYFNDYYDKLCGRFDIFCGGICNKITGASLMNEMVNLQKLKSMSKLSFHSSHSKESVNKSKSKSKSKSKGGDSSIAVDGEATKSSPRETLTDLVHVDSNETNDGEEYVSSQDLESI